MNHFIPWEFRENHFLLSANRTIYWEEEQALILSDLHLGKSGHFRKSGIAIPQNIFREDMQRLLNEIQYFRAKKLFIVGDLFHSTHNREHELFSRWRMDIPGIEFHLVKGNHDILKNKWYEENCIQTYAEKLVVGQFAFMHDINACEDQFEYCFSGHIHPGIRISGAGRQALQLPCFYFGETYAILPAFGKFTGTYALKPTAEDSVFALVENKVMQLQ